jgi:hypothetical protein
MPQMIKSAFEKTLMDDWNNLYFLYLLGINKAMRGRNDPNRITLKVINAQNKIERK